MVQGFERPGLRVWGRRVFRISGLQGMMLFAYCARRLFIPLDGRTCLSVTFVVAVSEHPFRLVCAIQTEGRRSFPSFFEWPGSRVATGRKSLLQPHIMCCLAAACVGAVVAVRHLVIHSLALGPD